MIHFSVIAFPHLEGLRILKGLESDVSSSYEKYFLISSVTWLEIWYVFSVAYSSSLECLPLPLKEKVKTQLYRVMRILLLKFL